MSRHKVLQTANPRNELVNCCDLQKFRFRIQHERQTNGPHVLKSLCGSIQIGSWAPGGPERKCPGHEAAKAPAKLLKTAPYTNCQHGWKVSSGSVTTCIHPSTYLTGKIPWTKSVLQNLAKPVHFGSEARLLIKKSSLNKPWIMVKEQLWQLLFAAHPSV